METNTFNGSLDDPSNFFIYQSALMHDVILQAQTAAKYPTTVLIEGESGTGKDLMAQFIHFSSNRYNKKFLILNCATFQESLIDSELFGYEKGSFTGALTQGKVGLLEQADEGTVFLDEISELPLNLQGKLLRFLQDKRIRRIGSTTVSPVDVRIIAATNRHLSTEVDRGTFRKDLYYRLSVINITIPPLRDRTEDIAILIFGYLNKFCSCYGISRTIEDEAVEAMCQYTWPGNVRELLNTIESLVIMNRTSEIKKSDLPLRILDSSKPNINYFFESLEGQMDRYEQKIIMQALDKSKSIRNAAEMLGISHSTLLRKMEKYNLKTLLG